MEDTFKSPSSARGIKFVLFAFVTLLIASALRWIAGWIHPGLAQDFVTGSEWLSIITHALLCLATYCWLKSGRPYLYVGLVCMGVYTLYEISTKIPALPMIEYPYSILLMTLVATGFGVILYHSAKVAGALGERKMKLNLIICMVTMVAETICLGIATYATLSRNNDLAKLIAIPFLVLSFADIVAVIYVVIASCKLLRLIAQSLQKEDKAEA